MATSSMVQGWVQRHRKVTLGIAAIVVVGAGVLIALPILRTMESRQLALAAREATQLTIEAMGSPSIFSGEPADAAAHLNQISDQLERLHDQLVLAHVHFAKGAWAATIDYTEFTQRYVLKLASVSKTIKDARDAAARYDDAVTSFKMTNAKDRVEVANALNEAQADARNRSEVAYQDCVLTHELTTQLSSAVSRARLALSDVGPDPAAAVSAFLARAEAAAADAQVLRRQFNPMAKAVF